MKTTTRSLLQTIVLVLFCLTASGEAQTLTKKQLNKYKGEYRGLVTGIAGNSTAGTAAVAFESRVEVTGKALEFVAPQISNLHASPRHRLVFRAAAGTERRVIFTGYYTGTAINPTSGLPEPVSGMRKMVIADRGKGKNVRFIMRFTDTLREGSYSAQELKGTLGKKK